MKLSVARLNLVLIRYFRVEFPLKCTAPVSKDKLISPGKEDLESVVYSVESRRGLVGSVLAFRRKARVRVPGQTSN